MTQALSVFINRHPNLAKHLLIGLSVMVVFAFTFQYFFLTDFPIGPDVVNHIAHEVYLEKIGYMKAFSTFLYPLSLIVFNIYHKLLVLVGADWEKSFIFTICFNVFVVAILTGVLTGKIFKDWRVGLSASILLASSRWINDSMRIGLLAESFGWIFLLLAFIFLFEKRWKLFIPSIFLLFFFHPMVFGVLMAYSSMIFIYLALWGEGSDKRVGRYFLLLYLILAVLFLTSEITVFRGIIDIVHLKFEPEGERGVINFITDSDKRRIFIYIMSFIGFLFLVLRSIKMRDRDKTIFFLAFTVFSFLLCFKHFFGIHYLSYRFYTYFEISTAICAAYGVKIILEALPLKKNTIVMIALSMVFALPNWRANMTLTKWQSTDYSVGSTTPIADRQVISETSKIIKSNSRIVGSSFWGYWYLSKSSSGYTMTPIIYSDSKQLYAYLYRNDISYVFFSSTDQKSMNTTESFLRLIYQKNGASLYEFVQ